MHPTLITSEHKTFFDKNGYLVIDQLISPQEVLSYLEIYNQFLDNKIDASQFRSDLSGSEQAKEKITQIMAPSKLAPSLLEGSIHEQTKLIAQALLGPDMALDFDMLINKAPYTQTPTPWHQDAAYWIDMPDKRAVSCWVAIDEATIDNGCMWYTPESHKKGLKPHFQTNNKGALQCEGSEQDSICIELKAGGCVLHHGHTLHYSRGNNTSTHRRALITNYRPIDMIKLERKKGIDHTQERQVRSKPSNETGQ